MAEKENNIIFDFTWGNTYGLFSEGYHVMIKDGGDLFLTWSVDLKYGETPLDNAKLEDFIKDLKALKIDSWNSKTYSDNSFEYADTWRIEVNNIGLILESKGANDYPPEWKQFLEYLHVKWSIPVSSRELPEDQRKELLKKRQEHSAAVEKKESGKKTGANPQGGKGRSNPDRERLNKDKTGADKTGNQGNKRKEPKANTNPRKEKPKASVKVSLKEQGEAPKAKDRSERPKKFRYHRRRQKSGEGSTPS